MGVSFQVSAEAYARFMGRYSEPLATGFLAVLEARPGQRAIDVGCGPGALTAGLVAVLGADSVSAVDPSEPFIAAIRPRLPGVDVRMAVAEQLPYEDDTFDLAAAQLVVHFMSDPAAGLVEMARVTRSGGTVAACVWDHGGGRGPLSTFWSAARKVDPQAMDESGLAGVREGHLAQLFRTAGLSQVETTELTVRAPHTSFEEWWEPYTLGVGPAGAYVSSLDEQQREALRARCEQLLPPSPFEVAATAWAVRAVSP